MYPLIRHLLNHFGHPRIRCPRERFRLRVQSLETRLLPAIMFEPQWGNETVVDAATAVAGGNGVAKTLLDISTLSPVIDQLAGAIHNAVKSPKVQIIFWGWTNSAIQQFNTNNPTPQFGNLPSMSDYYQAAVALFKEPFLQSTSQYDTNGYANLNGSLWIDHNPLPSQLNDGNLCSEVDNINNGNSDPQTVYVFVTPPVAQYNAGTMTYTATSVNQGFSSGTVGYNSFTKSAKPIPVIWAGATYAASPWSYTDEFTWDLSHEMVELMSSPTTWIEPAGYQNLPNAMDKNPVDQIADYEGNEYSFRTVNGVVVQPYWSAADNAYIADDGYSWNQFQLTPQWAGTTFQNNYDLHIAQQKFANDFYILGSRGHQHPDGFSLNGDGETVNFDPGSIHSAPDDPITVSPAGDSTLVLNLDDTHTDVTIDEEADGLHVTYAEPPPWPYNTKSPYTDYFLFNPGTITTLIINGTGDHENVHITNLNGGLTSIQINNHDSTNSFSVDNLPAGVSLSVQANFGTVSLCPDARNLSNIQGTLSIDGNATVILNDANAPGGTSYDIKPGFVDRNGTPFLVGASRTSFIAVTLDTPRKNPGNVEVYMGCLTPTVTLDAAPNSGQTLTVVEYTDMQLIPFWSISPSQITDKFISWGGTYWDTINYKNLASLDVYSTTAVVVNIDGTPAPTTVGLSVDKSVVNVDMNSMDLEDLGGTLTIHGGGHTTLNVGDQKDQTPGMRYLISKSELASQWYGPQGLYQLGWNPLATIDFDNLNDTLFDHVAGLNLHAATNATEIDVDSVPGAATIWTGAGATAVNISPTTKNLDDIGTVAVYGAGSQTGPDGFPQGKILGQTTVNIYDQGSPLRQAGSTGYNLTDGEFDRTSTFTMANMGMTETFHTEVDYYHSTGMTIDTGPTLGPVHVSSTGCATSINCAAPDTITVGNTLESIGQLTVNADGGTLTLTDTIANEDDDTTTITNRVTYGVSDQSVGYTNRWKETEYFDPQDFPQHKGPRVQHWSGTSFSIVYYQNVSSLTINSAPVDTSFYLYSTATGAPVTINTATDGTTTNTFKVGHKHTVKEIRSQLTLNGSSPKDSVVVDDSKATSQDLVTIANGQSNDVQLGMAVSDEFFAPGGGLDCSGMSLITLDLSKALGDVVHLTPSTVTAFAINGEVGYPAELDVDLLGITDALKLANKWTFTKGSHKTIRFSNVK